MSIVFGFLSACGDDPEPENPFVYERDIITAVIDGDEDFEATGSINGRELVFSIFQNRTFVVTGIDRTTINPLTIRIANFAGEGTYSFEPGENSASYILIEDDDTQNVFGTTSGEMVIESFADSIAIGTFQFELGGNLGSISFTEGEFALAVQ